jgi:hypothetical protein
MQDFSTTTAFQAKLEGILEELSTPVFPNREVTEHHSNGRVYQITKVVWHQFIKPEDVTGPSNVDSAACGKILWREVELPKLLNKKLEPKLCPSCSVHGDLSRSEMLAAIEKVFDALRNR